MRGIQQLALPQGAANLGFTEIVKAMNSQDWELVRETMTTFNIFFDLGADQPPSYRIERQRDRECMVFELIS